GAGATSITGFTGIRGVTAGSELVINQYNPSTVTINDPLANPSGGGAGSVSINGPGAVTLTNTNSFTGALGINNATTLTGTAATASAVNVGRGATLTLGAAAADRIGNAVSVSLFGGNLNLGGSSETV